jgi:hypothetical protein
MYSVDSKYPQTENELLNSLCESVTGTSKVAIVGGHFMLLYDKIEDDLKPMIVEELGNEKHREFAKYYAGDFPVLSFQYSLELFHYLENKNIPSEIILLVNDHKFQGKNFQTDIESLIVSGKCGELRKKYYKENKIPETYKEILKSKKIDPHKIFAINKNVKRTENDLLPKESWFYSEHKLRKRFGKYILPNLLKREEVNLIKHENEIIYQNPTKNVGICLTENGSCGCSAEVIELISNLQEKDVKEIIMFVPSECGDAVNNGIEAALNINGKVAKVTSITGFGKTSMNESHESFLIMEHIFE